MTACFRAILESDLAARLDAGQPDVVLLALHVGSGAAAIGITARVDPASTGGAEPADAAERARDALSAGDRECALRVCAEAMAGELSENEVAAVVNVLDEIRGPQ